MTCCSRRSADSLTLLAELPLASAMRIRPGDLPIAPGVAPLFEVIGAPATGGGLARPDCMFAGVIKPYKDILYKLL
jgi:hypothetical protein